MSTLKRSIGFSVIVFVLANAALAQENRAPIDTPQETVVTGPLVTVTATSRRVRFVSPGTVVQLRLEVYNETGQKLFDTELRGGNVMDWHLQDGAGERLPPGSYACVLTTKSLSGRISQRVGRVTVNGEGATVEAAGATQLSTAQQQTIGPVEDNGAFTILRQSEAEAITTVTHDGADGQVARTRGALSFRVGDFLSGKDKEQMLLTKEGNLGIGTSTPEAKLDVSGDIRTTGTLQTSKGIEFENGTRLTSTETGSLQQTLANGTVVDNATGTGTQGRLAKWTDNLGTLGNSVVTEAAGNIGVGTTPAVAKLEIAGANQSILATRFAGAGSATAVTLQKANGTQASPTALANGNEVAGFNFAGFDGDSFEVTARIQSFVDGPVSNGVVPQRVGITTGSTVAGRAERLSVTSLGNVGIGTTAPNSRLDVAGTVNAFQFNTGGQRLLVAGAGTLFVGTGAGSGTAAFGPVGNTFVGANAGVTNFSGSFNTMLGVVANVGANNLANATAIGARALVTQSNSLVLGSINGQNGATTDTNVGIGTTAPAAKLEVHNGTVLSSGATGGAFVARNPNNQAAALRLDWFNDTARIRYGGNGAGAENGFVIQGQGDATKLTVRNDGDLVAADDVVSSNRIFLISLDKGAGPFGPTFDLCAVQLNNTLGSSPLQITNCSSSIRYKTDVHSFTRGLDLLSRLRPVSFRWKNSSHEDVGLVAEEVELVEPLLVTRNAEGEVEGVKYDRLGVVLLNAVQEQQQQLRAMDRRIADLEWRLAQYDARLASLDQRLRRGRTARYARARKRR